MDIDPEFVREMIEEMKNDCLGGYCRGSEVEPEDMITCRLCYYVHELRKRYDRWYQRWGAAMKDDQECDILEG